MTYWDVPIDEPVRARRRDRKRELCEICESSPWLYEAIGADGFVWRMCYECARERSGEGSGYVFTFEDVRMED